MEAGTVYIIFLTILFLLAVSDLIVGVSNDAVNFLNSAIGAKVASKKVIMTVAACGIAIGATFSSGMMEVARKGIFNPGMYMFDEIMVVFVAVMLTDILLLDFFNTFGLPTSTTVSIVFELLGASTAIAGYKIVTENQSWSTLPDYINQEQAVLIISGIFLSVLVAFVVGMVVQYFARMLFTFNYERRLKKYGGIFGGLAITLITYFILLKGAKGTSFLTAETVTWIQENTWMINGIGLVFWTIICQLLISVFKVNILRVIVLMGTFSLAMAFAGNDLVNFIGVPIAGLISFQNWAASGEGATTFSMELLGESVRTDTYLLVLAGLIMTLTLIFSRKAQSVTATQVDLGRQGLGSERFKPNVVSRAIVGGSLFLGNAGRALIPTSIYDSIEKRFRELNENEAIEKNRPAFDLVRASVNLMVAAVLIAFATSLKLPLSTTYVSFMVAMGASLSDRAWNRDSAVYRVAGVVNVVAGWFFTALVAFVASSIMAIIIINTGVWGLIIITLLAAFLIFRSGVLHKKLESEKPKEMEKVLEQGSISLSALKSETATYIADTYKLSDALFTGLIDALEKGQSAPLKIQRHQLRKLRDRVMDVKGSMYLRLQKMESENGTGLQYLDVLNSLQNVQQAIDLIISQGHQHVRNFHMELDANTLDAFRQARAHYHEHINGLQQLLHGEAPGAISLQAEPVVIREISRVLEHEVGLIKNKATNYRNSMLLITILLETRDLVTNTAELTRQFRDL